MPRFSPFIQKGFTLVELIIVIIILSVVGTMTSRYIGTGVDIYNDIVDRDKSIGSIRFAMERLRREVTNSLPNSAFVDDDCLTFTPIISSSIYSVFPISPLSGNTGTISPISDYTHVAGDKAVVYLLAASELTSSNKVQTINSMTDSDTINFSGAVSFPLGSPAKRVYIIRDNISYCFSGTNLYRRVNSESDILMAENITGSFATSAATLQRNALVQVTFNLDFDGKEVPVEQTLHISNTP